MDSAEVQTEEPTWHTHIGYLLSGLYTTKCNLPELSEVTGTPVDVLSKAIESHGIDLMYLREFILDEPDCNMEQWFNAAGINPQKVAAMEPLPGVDLKAINKVEAERIHSVTSVCPLCGSHRKESSSSYVGEPGSGVLRFDFATFDCKTTLDRDGRVAESRQCMNRQVRKAMSENKAQG